VTVASWRAKDAARLRSISLKARLRSVSLKARLRSVSLKARLRAGHGGWTKAAVGVRANLLHLAP
jgi:hypothetical protein